MANSLLVPLLIALLALFGAALLVAVLRLSSQARAAEESRRGMESLRGDLAGRVDGLDRRSADLQGLLVQQLTATQQLLQERLAAQEGTLREQLSNQAASLQGQTGILQKHMQGTQATLAQVTEKMGAVAQTAARMAELGRDMEELQRLLRSPKARGQMGELGLETLLGDMLPRDRVVYQYPFSNGEKVDAMVRLDRGLLPIDAKFPMEDFQRFLEAPQEERPRARKSLRDNLKKKVDAIAQKYIRPGEGTLPLALMYLPAESLYYETFVARERDEEDLWDYAYRKSVLPLSPGTLSAYLKTVALGLRAAAVEQNARQVMAMLQTVERDLAAYRKPFEILGTHLSNARKQYDESSRLLQRVADHLERAREAGSDESGGAPPEEHA